MAECTKGKVELISQYGFRIVIKGTNRTIFRATQNDGTLKPILSIPEARANGERLVRLWNDNLNTKE